MKDELHGQGVSQCNKCGALYPSAPAGTLHKCGACSGGMCSPIPNRRATPAPMSDDTLIQKTAVALSMLDPDERALPEGVSMTAFYTQMARGVLSTIRPTIEAAAREKVEREVVAWLRSQCSDPMLPEFIVFLSGYTDVIERGEYRENGDG